MKQRNKKQRNISGFACVAALLLVTALPVAPVQALTGNDVMNKMSDDERGGYMTGSVSMAALISGSRGDWKRTTCIMNWYKKGGGVKQIVNALRHFKNRQAMPIIYALIQRACDK